MRGGQGTQKREHDIAGYLREGHKRGVSGQTWTGHIKGRGTGHTK